MRALVTGGNGFIGSHLVDELIEMGHHVEVIDDNSAESNEIFYFNDKAVNHRVDICDYEKVKEIMKGVDVVFHLAAESRIQTSILDPRHAAKVNVVGTCNVLQAARECGADRVIYSSTSAVYGLKNEPPLKEDMPKDCLNPYSVTKYAGEDLCVMYNDLFGLKTISFRYFNVYGERQPVKGQYAPVVGLFFEQKRKGGPMTIVGDGEQRRDFTHVSDVVDANLRAAFTKNEDAFGGVFNVGSGESHSVVELAKMIGGDYVHIDARMGEARKTLADIAKICRVLEWRPRMNFEDWVRENRN
jgi:UDP-glucose 4-epimerase